MRRSTIPRVLLTTAVLLVAAASVSSRASAQDASDSAAYLALIRTPLAALPLPLDASITGEHARGVAYRFRYGLMSFDTHEYTHNFGVGVEFPVGGAVVGATVGYHWPNCNGVCESNVMASVELSERLLAIPLGRGDDAGAFDIGVHAAVGFGTLTDTTLWSGRVAVPVSLVPGKGGVRFVPWVAPGVGVGAVRAGKSEAGLQFTFGAGLGLLAGDRFRADAGIDRVFLKGGNWLVGVGLSVLAR